MNLELLEILCCPENGQKLIQAEAELIKSLNAKIIKNELFNKDGQLVKETINEAIVRKDGKLLFVVKNNIPIMLLGESIPLD